MSGIPPLRGREGEFTLIRELLAAARSGEGSVLVVRGRAGFGKTRLLQSALELAAALGLRTGAGGAEDGGQAVPMMALMSALFAGPGPLLDRAKLRELPSAPEQRFWLLQELAELLEAAALTGPLLICLDDLQWADPGTLAAVRSLPAQLAGLPVVWIVALRPDGTPGEALATVESLCRSGAHQLDLGPLGPEAVEQVLGDLLSAEADAELLGLAARADGNPFLLVELLRGLLDEGRLRFAAGRAQLTGGRLPLRLRESMQVRLGYRSAAAQQLAGVAAEMGATWDATRVRGRLRRVGVRRNLRPARPATGWAGLTDSELAVVRLVAAGQTNHQIATQLYLSPHTVSSHLRHVFAKLEIRSRVELVRLFVSREAAADTAVPAGADSAGGDGRFPDRMNV